jgi:hypothetical protein
MAEEQLLPGWPKKRLVKAVKRSLALYGIRPTWPALWHETWAWAHKIASSYYRTCWPIPSEIAAQYVVLLLHFMAEGRALKLPFRASEQIPERLRQRLQGHQLPMIESKKEESK